MPGQFVSNELQSGLKLGHYTITEKIGEGGMGEVYRARDQHLDRDVAVKVLPQGVLADEGARRQFHREALALSKLSHPNIATIHDFDTQQGIDFLVMEYIPGETLSNRLESGPMREAEVARLGKQLAEGLRAAHEHGVIHGDLKPGNLRVTPDGWLKILDFGLAKLIRSTGPDFTTASFSQTHAFSGTLPYMAPEQLRGEKVDPRTDVYGLGAVLYEMATGQRLFPQRETPLLVDAILHDTPAGPTKVNQRISRGLDAILRKAVEKDPNRRYACVSEILEQLEQLAGPQPIHGPQLNLRFASRFSRALSRRDKLVIGMCLIAILAAFAVWNLRTTPALALAPRDYVLISDFENQTGDALFDRSLGAALATSLNQSTQASVYSRARIKETLARMEKPNVDKIDEALAEEIAQREGIKALIIPTISGIGENYRIAARVHAMSLDTDVRTEVVRAKGKAKVLDAIDELAAALRRDLGESLQHISKNSRPLATVTTQSLEALTQYSVAIEKHRATNVEEAKTYYENALRIDPQFTAAEASLGMLHLDQTAIGTPHFSAEEGRRLLADAVQHVSNLTDKEKYGILAFHALWVENNPEKAVQQYKILLGTYPQDATTWNNLAWVYRNMGRFDESADAAKEAIRLDPRMVIAYANLGNLYLYNVGDVKSALRVCEQALQVDPQNAWVLDCIGWSYLGEGKWMEAQPLYEKAVAANPNRTILRYRLAHTYRLLGRYREALQALQPIVKIDPSDTDVFYDMGVVWGLRGQQAEATSCFEKYRQSLAPRWKKNPKNADTAFGLSEVLLRLDQSRRGMALAKEALKLDPSRHFDYATLLCLNHQKQEAVKQLRLAIQTGYRNYVWIRIHSDLQELHGDPDFEKLISELIKN